MRLKINVSVVTKAQWEWLLVNLRQEWTFAPDDIRVCVEFEHEDGMQHRHVEVEVQAFVDTLKRLKALTEQGESTGQQAVLPVYPPYRGRGTEGY